MYSLKFGYCCYNHLFKFFFHVKFIYISLHYKPNQLILMTYFCCRSLLQLSLSAFDYSYIQKGCKLTAIIWISFVQQTDITYSRLFTCSTIPFLQPSPTPRSLLPPTPPSHSCKHPLQQYEDKSTSQIPHSHDFTKKTEVATPHEEIRKQKALKDVPKKTILTVVTGSFICCPSSKSLNASLNPLILPDRSRKL